MSLAELVLHRRIIVCVGSGGVGKTTTAASLALAAARAGRRVLVLTIDPARRLANALGLPALDHEERRVPDDKIAAGGVAVSGTLHAMMLDQKRAFDEVVREYATDSAQVERIQKNRIYQQISTTLTGSHEYAAMAKLYELSGSSKYDLIVLDTPPTANALDFLDAPGKLVSAIDSPALQWFLKPYLDGKSFSYKVVGFWGGSVLKRVAKFVGSRFLEDIGQFIGEFNTVLAGFRNRASDVLDLLRKPDVAFVVVCAPSPLTVDEALFFHERLTTQAMPHGGFVVNRVHAHGPPPPQREALIDALTARPELRGLGSDDFVQVASDLARTYAEFLALAEIDGQQIQRLKLVAGKLPCVEVPLFDRDIHDLDGLTLMAERLLA